MFFVKWFGVGWWLGCAWSAGAGQADGPPGLALPGAGAFGRAG
jgi:hypothetical protein